MTRDESATTRLTPEELATHLAAVGAVIPPLWPLPDYVAVNPFLGLADRPFLVARQLLADVRVCDILPSAEWLRQRLSTGEIAPADLDTALAECREEHPEWFAGLSLDDCRALLNEAPAAVGSERRYRTVSELVDERTGTRWTSHIVTDISRHCAGHFDRGQASWMSPWLSLPLYEAWRQRTRLSRRLDELGIRGCRQLVASLPEDPLDAIPDLLARLAIPRPHVERFLLAELFSVAGWASYVRQLAWHAEDSSAVGDDLTGLLAIRLACDVALAEWSGVKDLPTALVPESPEPPAPRPAVLARYLMQVAGEVAHRRRLLADIASVKKPAATGRPTLQMVFCIDVRSEVLRRHLEAQSDRVETLGFAGFFGMPLEFIRLGTAYGAAHCPVLLQPSFPVFERLLGASRERVTAAIDHRKMLRKGRKLWKGFQSSSISCYSFVESLGLAYLPKLLTDSLGVTRPVADPRNDGLTLDEQRRLGPDLDGSDDPLPLDQRVSLAAGMLRNLGLTDRFARIVAICGHAASMVNNPYQSGYDCGACGGHSGEPNARVAAAILNDIQVRAALVDQGIVIPADTWFVAAVHRTTTDEIEFFGPTGCPATHHDEFRDVLAWTAAAGNATRQERRRRLGNATDEAVLFRARDWAEVRPEWGLAGNAAVIVADRSRTAGLDLGGRSFLHEYCPAKDPGGRVLEVIMTAPMVVTSWIGLQYFASAVDNQAFGSGSKVIHDVVGQFGILEGNGGDLRVGLPWQAVHDGSTLQHEPLRLTVFIEASRERVGDILDRHPGVRDLVTHNWLRLVVEDAGTRYRWTPAAAWRSL
ncbi:MAG: YbcC family protein [Planctomycetaceae bacterium]